MQPHTQNLSDFMNHAWGKNPDYDGLNAVIEAIALGALQVEAEVREAALSGSIGSTGEINVHGEIVQTLDRAGSDIFVEVLRNSGRVAAIGCEELENPVIVSKDKNRNYVVLMDPVDGSSNIDVAVSIGSIFGIWRRGHEDSVSETSMLRPGNEQIAAAYIIYGSSTVLVIATAGSVQAFTLHVNSNEFRLTHPNIKIPSTCQYYSTNDGNFNLLDETMQKVLIQLRDLYSLRYVGSLVADFHRNLLKGGVFLYPGDRKNPEGKLRLMYEANPLGFVAIQAGGAASSGKNPIMDIKPSALHQRTPLILGNRDVVEQITTPFLQT